MNVIRGFRELVAEAEAGVDALDPDEVRRRLAEPGTLLVDLRDVRELSRDGRIPGALHVPRGMLEFWIDPDSPYYRHEFDEAEALILYCNKGWRSALAAASLQAMGITAVAHLAGGMEHWQESGGEIEAPVGKEGRR
ncbi:MAG: rhodanese-like domain-containing protein [Pseudohongiellaceae bacterium]